MKTVLAWLGLWSAEAVAADEAAVLHPWMNEIQRLVFIQRMMRLWTGDWRAYISSSFFLTAALWSFAVITGPFQALGAVISLTWCQWALLRWKRTNLPKIQNFEMMASDYVMAAGLIFGLGNLLRKRLRKNPEGLGDTKRRVLTWFDTVWVVCIVPMMIYGGWKSATRFWKQTREIFGYVSSALNVAKFFSGFFDDDDDDDESGFVHMVSSVFSFLKKRVQNLVAKSDDDDDDEKIEFKTVERRDRDTEAPPIVLDVSEMRTIVDDDSSWGKLKKMMKNQKLLIPFVAVTIVVVFLLVIYMVARRKQGVKEGLSSWLFGTSAVSGPGCLHAPSCPRKELAGTANANKVCNVACGGHHCTHWRECDPTKCTTAYEGIVCDGWSGLEMKVLEADKPKRNYVPSSPNPSDLEDKTWDKAQRWFENWERKLDSWKNDDDFSVQGKEDAEKHLQRLDDLEWEYVVKAQTPGFVLSGEALTNAIKNYKRHNTKEDMWDAVIGEADWQRREDSRKRIKAEAVELMKSRTSVDEAKEVVPAWAGKLFARVDELVAAQAKQKDVDWKLMQAEWKVQQARNDAADQMAREVVAAPQGVVARLAQAVGLEAQPVNKADEIAQAVESVLEARGWTTVKREKKQKKDLDRKHKVCAKCNKQHAGPQCSEEDYREWARKTPCDRNLNRCFGADKCWFLHEKKEVLDQVMATAAVEHKAHVHLPNAPKPPKILVHPSVAEIAALKKKIQQLEEKSNRPEAMLVNKKQFLPLRFIDSMGWAKTNTWEMNAVCIGGRLVVCKHIFKGSNGKVTFAFRLRGKICFHEYEIKDGKSQEPDTISFPKPRDVHDLADDGSLCVSAEWSSLPSVSMSNTVTVGGAMMWVGFSNYADWCQGAKLLKSGPGKIVKVENGSVFYKNDTEGGNCTGVILNDDSNVIALHQGNQNDLNHGAQTGKSYAAVLVGAHGVGK